MKILLSALIVFVTIYSINMLSFLIQDETSTIYKKVHKITVPILIGIVIFIGIYGIYLLLKTN